MKKPFPFTFIVVAAFYSCIQMGCDRDNPASVPRNSQPVIEGIADIVVDAGAETTVEVSITDADAEDNQTLHASSDDTAIATVSVSNSTLTISGIAGGVTAITVSATDDSEQDNAESEPVTFRVTVDRNSQPVIEGIADIVVDAGAEMPVPTVEVSITDADAEDNQTLHASSDDTAIATVSVSNSTLTISGIAGGVTAITVSATDDSEQDNAESEPVTFRVTVDRNSQPVIEGIADIVVDAGAETTVEVSITDADAEDNQTLHASSDDTAIATVSVSNSTLTISGIAGGVTAITVSATDDSEQDNAESEPVTFRVTVTERPPEPGKFSDFNEGWDNADIWRSMDANGEIVACREGLRLPRDSFCLDENFHFSSDYSQLLDTRFLVAHLPDGDGLVLQGRSQFRAGRGLQLGWITLEKIGSEFVITHLNP